MKMQKTTTNDIQVAITTSYVPEQSKPEIGYHFFAYKISITNKGGRMAQLMSRHWIITDALGRTEDVRGPGVVGLQPKIKPGQSFEYESACPLHTTSGTMRGSFQMVSENGDSMAVEIPEFFLIAPQALH